MISFFKQPYTFLLASGITKDMTDASSLETGIQVIRDYLVHLPLRPGVYRMLSADGTVLYVGKAKSLKKRVTNYTQVPRMPLRIQRMVALTRQMEFVETHTEGEALLLEANLIKSLRPVYNVLLKDDKMFPSILIPKDHDFPGVYKHRGTRTREGYYFGPFLSGSAVSDTITLIHKVFQIRNCTDSYFAARTRPCLQYHIKRCTAPCVQKVSKSEYAQQVEQARAFLDGKSSDVQDYFTKKMQDASDQMDFETAATYRDRIRTLRSLLARQDINMTDIQNADVMATVIERGIPCIQVFLFRGGQNYGHLSFFPSHTDDMDAAGLLSGFMSQFYADQTPPPEIIVSHEPEDMAFLMEALRQRSGHKVQITLPKRGERRRVLDFALKNAHEALDRHIAQRTAEKAIMNDIQTLFDLPQPPERIEIYDNSHLAGTGMVGGMVVAGPEGFHKNAYRKFNIKTADASDDYGMMREVMQRRFTRALTEGQGPGTENWPDLLLIDGGLGQLNAVTETLREIGVLDDLVVVGISKGPDRNAGREFFHMIDRPPFQLPPADPVLHYLQRLRDEAHRFAIGAQRTRRTASITQSALDDIPGIGSKRKRALLLHFGSAKEVANAALSDLEKVEGISKAFAQKIYQYFHK